MHSPLVVLFRSYPRAPQTAPGNTWDLKIARELGDACLPLPGPPATTRNKLLLPPPPLFLYKLAHKTSESWLHSPVPHPGVTLIVPTRTHSPTPPFPSR